MIFFNDLINNIENEQYYTNEVERLNMFLLQNINAKQNIIENVTDDLLNAYYQERQKICPKGREDEHRKNMIVFDATLSTVICYICRRINYSYTNSYIKSWQVRCKYFPFADLMRGKEPQQKEHLPKELDIPEARAMFVKAIGVKLMEQKADLYHWNCSKALLAYFTEQIYCKENGADNGKDYPETALNTLFNVSRLGKARSQLANNKKLQGKPNGYEKIDILFKAAD